MVLHLVGHVHIYIYMYIYGHFSFVLLSNSYWKHLHIKFGRRLSHWTCSLVGAGFLALSRGRRRCVCNVVLLGAHAFGCFFRRRRGRRRPIDIMSCSAALCAKINKERLMCSVTQSPPVHFVQHICCFWYDL